MHVDGLAAVHLDVTVTAQVFKCLGHLHTYHNVKGEAADTVRASLVVFHPSATYADFFHMGTTLLKQAAATTSKDGDACNMWLALHWQTCVGIMHNKGNLEG